jgi:EpsI family protein
LLDNDRTLVAHGHHLVKPQRFVAIAVCFAMVMAWPTLLLRSFDLRTPANPVSLALAPAADSGWQEAAESPDLVFRPAFRNPSTELIRSFVSQGHAVGLYLGYYLNQGDQHKLVSSSNVLVRSSDPHWQAVATSQQPVRFIGQSSAVQVTELRQVTSAESVPGRRLLVWRLYWVGGTVTASDYLAKAYTAWNRLTGRGDEAAVVVLYTAMDQPDEASTRLASFLASHDAAIHQALVKAKRPTN